MLTPPSEVCRIDVEAADGCSRLPPRSAAEFRAMNSRCAAIVASTVAGPARSHDRSSSQMNTMYSAISPASPSGPRVITAPPRSGRNDLGDLNVNAVGQPRAAGRQRGRGVQVRGVDDHVTGQHGTARLATARGGQGTGRADPVAGVHDRRPELPEPRPPRLLLLRRRGPVRLPAEGQDVLAHGNAPFEPGPPPAAGPSPITSHRTRPDRHPPPGTAQTPGRFRRSCRPGPAPRRSKRKRHTT